MADTKFTYRIADMAENDRPRERLELIGAESLSNAELIAILLRVGIKGENAVQMGNRVLTTVGGLRGLHRASFSEVAGIRGMGCAKTAQLKAAIELGRRLALEDTVEKPFLGSPKLVFDLVQYEMAAFSQEHLWVINLDTRNHLLKIERLYKGSLNASTVRVGEIFRSAIQNNAASIILVHNHPSGDPSPSPEDINLTRVVAQSGKLLDIDVLDHIVIGDGKFVSLKERGLGFSP